MEENHHAKKQLESGLLQGDDLVCLRQPHLEALGAYGTLSANSLPVHGSV